MTLLDRLQPWIRPAIVLSCLGFLLLGGYIAFALEQLRGGLGREFIAIMGAWLDAIPGEIVTGLFGILLAFIGAREAGKWAEKKYGGGEAPARRPQGRRPMPRPTFGEETGEISDDENR